VQQLTLII